MKKERRKFQYKREYTPVIIAVMVLCLLITGLYVVVNYNKEIISDVNENEIENKFEEIEISVSKNDNSLKKAANDVKIEYGYVDLIEGDKPADYTLNMIIERTYNADSLADIMDEMQSTDDDKYLIDKYLYVRFTGISSDIYVKINSDLIEYNKEYRYVDGKKNYNFLTNFIYEDTLYTVEIYSNEGNTLLRKITFSPPTVNIYHDTYLCMLNMDIPECQLFADNKLTFTEMAEITGYDENRDPYEIVEEAKKQKEAKRDETYKNVEKVVNNKYLFYYILGGILLLLIVVVIVVRGKKNVKK